MTYVIQPSITIDEWYAMNADGQLEWLAREVGRREKRCAEAGERVVCWARIYPPRSR